MKANQHYVLKKNAIDLCTISIYCDRKHFCHYYLQSFSTTKIIVLKVIAHKLKYLNKVKPVISVYVQKITSPFMIYAHFENCLVLKYNGKQTLNV